MGVTRLIYGGGGSVALVSRNAVLMGRTVVLVCRTPVLVSRIESW